ncbi:unnamed protein product [Diplocarpon coronariae]
MSSTPGANADPEHELPARRRRSARLSVNKFTNLAQNICGSAPQTCERDFSRDIFAAPPRASWAAELKRDIRSAYSVAASRKPTPAKARDRDTASQDQPERIGRGVTRRAWLQRLALTIMRANMKNAHTPICVGDMWWERPLSLGSRWRTTPLKFRDHVNRPQTVHEAGERERERDRDEDRQSATRLDFNLALGSPTPCPDAFLAPGIPRSTEPRVSSGRLTCTHCSTTTSHGTSHGTSARLGARTENRAPVPSRHVDPRIDMGVSPTPSRL